MKNDKMINKVLLKISDMELNLENTFLTGQCANWIKLKENKYKGIFNEYLILLERID